MTHFSIVSTCPMNESGVTGLMKICMSMIGRLHSYLHYDTAASFLIK